MLFSDYHITPNIKVEILPTDLTEQQSNILENYDNFIAIYRGVNGNLVAKVCKIEFLNEFRALVKIDHLSIKDALTRTVQNINFSCLNPPAELELRPLQGAMLLVLYINKKTITYAQVGDIKLKMKSSSSKYKVINENHTFSNVNEVKNLKKTDFFQSNFSKDQINELIVQISRMCNFKSADFNDIPSRFIGHPNLCGSSNDSSNTLVNTHPHIGTVKL